VEKVDVLIVGSGHSGGMAAKVLTGKGIHCLMLNAGPIPDYAKETETVAAYHSHTTVSTCRGGCQPLPGHRVSTAPMGRPAGSSLYV